MENSKGAELKATDLLNDDLNQPFIDISQTNNLELEEDSQNDKFRSKYGVIGDNLSLTRNDGLMKPTGAITGNNASILLKSTT